MYFFTAVTHKRRKILCDESAIEHPVKHGLARAPKDWKYTSFHRRVRDGSYDVNWCAGEELAFPETVGHE